MFIETINQISPDNFFASPASKPATNDFDNLLNNEITKIDNAIRDADMEVRNFAVGDSDNLHQVMISLSKAQTSFELAVQIRNKVVEGAQELFRMSI